MYRKLLDLYDRTTTIQVGRNVRKTVTKLGWAAALLLVVALVVTFMGDGPLPAKAQGGSAGHNGRPTVNYIIQV